MTIYEVMFVDGSSYILSADEIQREGQKIIFYTYSKKHDGTYDRIAEFKSCEVRGVIVKGEIDETDI